MRRLLLVDPNRIVDFVKVALDVDEALALGLGHREERVRHDDRGHHGVAGEGAVETAALRRRSMVTWWVENPWNSTTQRTFGASNVHGLTRHYSKALLSC